MRVAIVFALILAGCPSSSPDSKEDRSPCTAIIDESTPPPAKYQQHASIVATVSWVGEGGEINRASAWEPDWIGRFGGIDEPGGRAGYCPGTFLPKENPFYVGLPYNDLDAMGKRRPDAAGAVPWFQEAEAANAALASEAGATKRLRSVLEHRWVEITKENLRCYAQWEDVGPFLDDDVAYVFGTAPPRNMVDEKAGIELSPGLATCLKIDGEGLVSWRFVDFNDVPKGPWTISITRPR